MLRELKLANDNLRWRLQQRNKLLAANQAVIARYRDGLFQSEQALAEASREREECRRELAEVKRHLAAAVAAGDGKKDERKAGSGETFL